MAVKRVVWIVLDSLGIGEAPDACKYSDCGSNTFATIAKSDKLNIPNLEKLGFLNIDGVSAGARLNIPLAAYGRAQEMSFGKDTTTGHWEMAGIVLDKPFPTYPDGFPDDIIKKYEELTGRGVLCNKPYSGTDVIHDYGREQIETGKLIVYTSADSVFQVAAHEEHIGLDELYRCCEIARDMLVGEHGVGRVIARPYIGEYPNYKRTSNRHDYSLVPHKLTVPKAVQNAGKDSIGVGKIYDIFAGDGITKTYKTTSNTDGMDKTMNIIKEGFEGLCFVNLVDFDMLYGHRNDIDGYAKSLSEFDKWLDTLLDVLSDDDVLIITADHGCDPGTSSTDHSREYIPVLFYGSKIRRGVNIGTRQTFADIGATVLELLGIDEKVDGTSFAKNIFEE